MPDILNNFGQLIKSVGSTTPPNPVAQPSPLSALIKGVSASNAAFDTQQKKIDAIQQAAANGQPEPVFPKYNTGARSFIRVGGKSLAVCMDFRWKVNATGNEIRTIDTNLPWEISPGQITISAVLNNIVDPLSSMEAIGLFHTMQSFIHQPCIDMQVLDTDGISIFFASGMFLGVDGSVVKGQVSNISAVFQGIMYQHNAYQGFKPYDGTALSDKIGDAIAGYLK